MTEAAANGLELIDILPNLLEQISFLKTLPEEMNDEEMKLLNKLIMFLSPSKRFPKVFCSNLNYAS
jgi:hypothetical protein